MFMRIRQNLRNEFEHMDGLNLKTHADREAGPLLGCGGDIDFLKLLTHALALRFHCPGQHYWFKNSTLIKLLKKTPKPRLCLNGHNLG